MKTINTYIDFTISKSLKMFPEGKFKENLRKVIFRYYNNLYALNKLIRKIELPYGVKGEILVELANGLKLYGNPNKPLPGVLFTDNLRKRKGVDILIRAFKDIIGRMNNVSLVIVGSGEEEKNLKDLTKKLQLQSYTEFTGRVSDEEIKLWYNACDVHCAPSRKEAFGIIYVEAMACGKPVIGPNHGGPKEIIEDGITGFLFKSENVKDLAEKLVILLNNDKIRESMGERARKVVEEKYSWGINANKTYELYKRVLKKKN